MAAKPSNYKPFPITFSQFKTWLMEQSAGAILGKTTPQDLPLSFCLKTLIPAVRVRVGLHDCIIYQQLDPLIEPTFDILGVPITGCSNYECELPSTFKLIVELMYGTERRIEYLTKEDLLEII